MEFLHVLQAEWLKKKGSFASWMILLGALFIPLIQLLTFLFYEIKLRELHLDPSGLWYNYLIKSWSNMGVIFLPIGIVLACSLICQLEFKNQAWKQVQVSPVRKSNIYLAKLATLLIMQLQLFILFNVFSALAILIPSSLYGLPSLLFSDYPFDLLSFLKYNFMLFWVCLPLVLLQYNLSLHFKNIFVPVGIGIALVVLGITAMSWEYSYLIPSLYPYFETLTESIRKLYPEKLIETPNVSLYATFYNLVLFVGGLILFIKKPQNGN